MDETDESLELLARIVRDIYGEDARPRVEPIHTGASSARWQATIWRHGIVLEREVLAPTPKGAARRMAARLLKDAETRHASAIRLRKDAEALGLPGLGVSA